MRAPELFLIERAIFWLKRQRVALHLQYCGSQGDMKQRPLTIAKIIERTHLSSFIWIEGELSAANKLLKPAFN